MPVTDVFECASATLAACCAVLRRLTPDDLGRASPCAEFTVGEVGEHVVRSMVLLGSVAGAACAAPAVAAPAVAGPLDERVTATTTAAVEAWRSRGLGLD